MSEFILAEWASTSEQSKSYTIIPDGCRDLIRWEAPGKPPRWYVSPLFDRCHTVEANANTSIYGYRLRPGVRIDEKLLLQNVNENNNASIGPYFEEFIHYDHRVADALACLATNIITVENAANELGVTIRTLQRLVKSETGRSPGYWKNLARVRNTARDIVKTGPSADLANKHGYSDQPHMCREIKRWFNIQPAILKNSAHIYEQLNNKAYS